MPCLLHLPHHMLRRGLRPRELLARPSEWHRYALSRPELAFVSDLMARKPNLWVYRCHQGRYCGDFAVVDMSAPWPQRRRAWLVELKTRRGQAPLKLAGAPHAWEQLFRERVIERRGVSLRSDPQAFLDLM